jgi:hypothetical protein
VRLFGAAEEQELLGLGDAFVLIAIVESDAQQADDFRIRFLGGALAWHGIAPDAPQ